MKTRLFFNEEEHKGILFIMAFILGILTYFSLPFEPLFLDVMLLMGLLCVAFIIAYMLKRFHFITFFLFMFMLGIGVSTWHTSITNTRFLSQPVTHVQVLGEVESVKNKITSAEVVLKNVSILGMNNQQTPEKIKVWVPLKAVKLGYEKQTLPACADENRLDHFSNMRGLEKKSKRVSTDTCLYKRPQPAILEKGDMIKGMAFQLNPPAMPQVINGHNQARTLFFDKIGGVASFSECYILKKNVQKIDLLSLIKQTIQNKISFLKTDTKGVVNALILGEQGQVSTSVETLYRALGLTHILSVSGFHIALITLLIYNLVRYLLTFIFLKTNVSPVLIRRLSAVSGLFVSFLYVILSGAEPPAVRSFIMILFLFMCFFFYRNTFSVRTIFITAFLLLCYKPVLLLSAGFQLSFIAVLSLCVLVKEFSNRLKSLTLMHPILSFLLGLLLLNTLVTLATLPFVGYHFHKIALYGIVGNLALSFVFSFLIMPLLICSVFLMPFGYEKNVLLLTEDILSLVHNVGEKITLLPHWMIPVPYFATWGLVLFAFGFILFCVLKKKARLMGGVMMLLAPLAFFTSPKADLILAREGRLIAVRQENGQLLLNESYRHRFVSDMLLLQEGILPEHYQNNQLFQPNLLKIKGKTIAFLPDSCEKADMTFAVKKKDYSHCPNLYLKEKLQEMGTVMFFIQDDEISFKSLNEIDLHRPWNIKNQNKSF